MKINKVEKIARVTNNLANNNKQFNQSNKNKKADEGKTFKDILQRLDVRI